jgi:hypothetical protein
MKMINSKKHPLIPDFLIIGAGKSGTTSLDNYLKQHPEIFIPDVKEPNFFGYETVHRARLSPDERLHYDQSVTRLADYLALFESANTGQLLGETSNTYMYHDDAPKRIKYYNPNVKLIAILRQPAGRLYSRFLHLAREKRTPTAQFADCLDKQSIWWRRNDLIPEGFYYKNLSKYYTMFPKENIRVYLYEEFNEHPEAVMKDIFTFLGVDPNFKVNSNVKFNESGFIKNDFLNKIYGQKGLVIRTVKALLPSLFIKGLKKNLFVQKQLNKLRSKNLVKPGMDPQVKFRLTHEVYGDDIRNLQNLIGKDLSSWLGVQKSAVKVSNAERLSA